MTPHTLPDYAIWAFAAVVCVAGPHLVPPLTDMIVRLT